MRHLITCLLLLLPAACRADAPDPPASGEVSWMPPKRSAEVRQRELLRIHQFRYEAQLFWRQALAVEAEIRRAEAGLRLKELPEDWTRKRLKRLLEIRAHCYSQARAYFKAVAAAETWVLYPEPPRAAGP